MAVVVLAVLFDWIADMMASNELPSAEIMTGLPNNESFSSFWPAGSTVRARPSCTTDSRQSQKRLVHESDAHVVHTIASAFAVYRNAHTSQANVVSLQMLLLYAMS